MESLYYTVGNDADDRILTLAGLDLSVPAEGGADESFEDMAHNIVSTYYINYDSSDDSEVAGADGGDDADDTSDVWDDDAPIDNWSLASSPRPSPPASPPASPRGGVEETKSGPPVLSFADMVVKSKPNTTRTLMDFMVTKPAAQTRSLTSFIREKTHST